MKRSTPFLVLFADEPCDESNPEAHEDENEPSVQDPTRFHTRCGHPRHVDD